MALPPFAVTFDYRCPFARNAHEFLAVSLEAGAGWDVTFTPFSLSQAHVPEGGVPVWEDPAKAADLTALAAGLVVRDRFPEQFLAVHRALFEARHDLGRDLRDRAVVHSVLASGGVDADEVLAEIDRGGPLAELAREHERAVRDYEVFGVPTFILGGRAAFVRLTTRPEGDPDQAMATIDRLVRLMVDEPGLNEFKYTTISN